MVRSIPENVHYYIVLKVFTRGDILNSIDVITRLDVKERSFLARVLLGKGPATLGSLNSELCGLYVRCWLRR